MLAHLFSTLLLVLSVQIQESIVKKPAAQVDFTHHSHFTKLQDGKFSVTNFIRNNSSGRPLSIKWDDAGVLCTGSLQLPPGESDYGTVGGVIDKPALKTKSDIAYGVSLQYLAHASIYVDPNSQSAKVNTRTSVYERHDADGKMRFRIEVTSSLEEKAAVTTIRVSGGLSLIFQSQLLGEKPKISEGWSLARVLSLTEAGIPDERLIGAFIRSNRVPMWDISPDIIGATEDAYSVLRSSITSANEVTFRSGGDEMTLTRVSLAGFYPEMPGVLGMTADVYLPSRPRR
jgi:hypothetical protein